MHVLADLVSIFYFIVFPVLLLAGIGYLVQRRLGVDMPTLVRLNFFFVVPGMVYYAVVASTVRWRDAGLIVGFSVLVVLLMIGLALLLARWRGVPPDQRNCLAMSCMMYNSGNYGLPLQELAFRPVGLGPEAVLLQTFVLLTQNIMGFTLGVFMAASGKKSVSLRSTLTEIRRFPPIYALAAGFLTVGLRDLLGDRAQSLEPVLTPFYDVLVYVKQAFIAVALFTLGAQLALLKKESGHGSTAWAVLLRLLGGPAVALLLVYLFGLQGFVAQLLFISAATPTAVNCLLLCMEFDNHPDLAARIVLYTTLLSPLTITAVIFLARSGWIPAIMLP